MGVGFAREGWERETETHAEGKKRTHLGYMPIIPVWEIDHKFGPTLAYHISKQSKGQAWGT